MDIIIMIVFYLVLPQIFMAITVLLNLTVRKLSWSKSVQDAKDFRLFIYIMGIPLFIILIISNLLS